MTQSSEDHRSKARSRYLVAACATAGLACGTVFAVTSASYVKKEALNGPVPRTPEEAAQLSSEPRVIPVYESDGATQVGWFTIGENVVETGG